MPLLPSATRLRQIALVVEDLERAKYILTNVIGTEVIFADPWVATWGLKNFLVAIGGDVIEVVSPTRPNTNAGRLLSKRGEGGYMFMMQTSDAAARRSHLETNGLAKVILSHDGDDFTCVQYHPKGIKGGIMPGLDSQTSSPSNPAPITTRFSPWHACGEDYQSYSEGMKRSSHLRLVDAVCRLAPGDTDTQGAARQWRDLFGVLRVGDQLEFTNMHVKFIEGAPGEAEGLESITIAVEGKDKFNAILRRAGEEGLCGDGWINMLGIKWDFVLLGKEGAESKL